MDEIFASYVKENPEMLAYATELTSASTNLFTLRALYEKEFNELPDMTGRGMEIKLRLANALFEKRYNQPIFTNAEIFAPSSASPKPKQEGEMKKSNGTEGPSTPQNEEAPAKKRGRPSLFAEGDESPPPEAEDSPAPSVAKRRGRPPGSKNHTPVVAKDVPAPEEAPAAMSGLQEMLSDMSASHAHQDKRLYRIEDSLSQINEWTRKITEAFERLSKVQSLIVDIATLSASHLGKATGVGKTLDAKIQEVREYYLGEEGTD